MAQKQKLPAVLLFCFLSSGLGANQEVNENQKIAKHAASCAAYYFAAARARGMSEYETLYDAGEYAFNSAVTAVEEASALEHFNNASTHINHVMQKRWVDFYKVDDQYAEKCKKLLSASRQASKGNGK